MPSRRLFFGFPAGFSGSSSKTLNRSSVNDAIAATAHTWEKNRKPLFISVFYIIIENMPPKRRYASRRAFGALQNGTVSALPSSVPPSPSSLPIASPSPRGGRKANKFVSPASKVTVAGARMSGSKHSGLLAKDDQLLTDASADGTPTESVFSAAVGMREKEREGGGEKEEEEEGEMECVFGQDIFSINSLSRSAKKGKQKMAEMIAGCSPASAVARGKGKNVGSMVRDQREKEQEEEEEGTEKEKEVPVKRGRGQPRKTERVSQSDVEVLTPKKVRKGNKMDDGRGRTLKETELVTALMSNSDQDEEEEEEEKGVVEEEEKKNDKRNKEKGWKDLEEEGEDEEEEDEEDLASIAAQLNSGKTGESLGQHMVQDFFTARASKSATSDHTLSRLACPRPEQETVQTALETAQTRFLTDRQELCSEYKTFYPYWLLQLSFGFHILLHGLGSKKKLLEDFCSQCLSSSCQLIVNGYFPGLTAKQILSSLSCELLGHEKSFKSVTEHAEFICRALSSRAGKDAPQEVFLIIHSLDGPMLRNERTQSALSILATCPHVHILASVDHINAPLLWNQTLLGRFNWLWHDVTTFEPYREETSYENSLLLRQSGSLALSSLVHVMSSLTPNARGIFELLARHQLEHQRDGERGYTGLSFSECYRRCKEKFLVNNDLTLRAQLTEFRDHRLVRSTKGGDGVEYLFIPVDNATLSHFLEGFVQQ